MIFRNFPMYWDIIRKSPWYHQFFVGMVLLQTIYMIVERVILLFFANLSGNQGREAFWFFGVIVMSVLFNAYYGIHSILSVNYMEIGAFRAVELWLLIRIIIDYANRSEECSEGQASTVCLSFLILAIIFNVGTIVLSFFMLSDLKWKKFKAIGAQVSTRELYTLFELFSAVRKVDLQFSVITLYTGLVYTSTNLSSRTAQFVLGANIALFIIEIVWEILGDQAIKTEDTFKLYIFWILSIFLPIFIINVGIDYYTDNALLSLNGSPSILITILIFAILAIINRIATVWCSVMLFRSFGEPYRPLRRIFEGGRMSKFVSTGKKAYLTPEQLAASSTSSSSIDGGALSSSTSTGLPTSASSKALLGTKRALSLSASGMAATETSSPNVIRNPVADALSGDSQDIASGGNMWTSSARSSYLNARGENQIEEWGTMIGQR
jgi:hypothetical protein